MDSEFTEEEFNDAYAEGAVQSLQSIGFNAARSAGGGVRIGNSIFGAVIKLQGEGAVRNGAIMLLVNEYDDTQLSQGASEGLCILSALADGIPIVTPSSPDETHESMAAGHEKHLNDSAKSLYALAEEAVTLARVLEKHAKALR